MNEAPSRTARPRFTVLIIESQSSARTRLEMALLCPDICLFSAVTVESALLQLRVLEPDLILLRPELLRDTAQLPMDGARLLARSRLLVLGGSHGFPAEIQPAGCLPFPPESDDLCSTVLHLLTQPKPGAPGR